MLALLSTLKGARAYLYFMNLLISKLSILLAILVYLTSFSFASSPKISRKFPVVDSKVASEAIFGSDVSMEQLRLVRIAKSYAEKKFVPYVWGGGRVGPRKSCYRCSQCIKKYRVDVRDRLSACDECRRCGIDCSHFVNRVYRESGLSYPYATTFELSRLNSKRVLEYYDLFNVGTDISHAQPGDLVLYKRHIIMIVEIHSDLTIDFVHVTRFGDRYKHGGIRYEKRKNVESMRGGLVKILRHRDLIEKDQMFQVAGVVQPL